jgi:hypothetical protein
MAIIRPDMFRRDGTSWDQIAKLTAGDAKPSDQFGFSVFLKNGYAIVGARYHDDPLYLNMKTDP